MFGAANLFDLLRKVLRCCKTFLSQERETSVVAIVLPSIFSLAHWSILVGWAFFTTRNYSNDICRCQKNMIFCPPSPRPHHSGMFWTTSLPFSIRGTRIQTFAKGSRRQKAMDIASHESIADANDEDCEICHFVGTIPVNGASKHRPQTTVSQIRGDDVFATALPGSKRTTVIYSVKIDKDAFHWHNAGRLYPDDGPTESAVYVANALSIWSI